MSITSTLIFGTSGYIVGSVLYSYYKKDNARADKILLPTIGGVIGCVSFLTSYGVYNNKSKLISYVKN